MVVFQGNLHKNKMLLFRTFHPSSQFCSFMKKRSFIVRYGSTMGNLTLYGDEASPPVRFVMMTASILNVNYTFHKIDLFKSKNKTDFFKKINPLQKVPALAVDGEIICDSHVISLYLCQRTQYQTLYPLDSLQKARVDQMLMFNATNLFPIDSFIFTEYFAGKKSIDQQKLENWHFSLKYLNQRLNKYIWLAGDQMQLCDICCGATISSLELLVPSIQNYAAVKSWMERLQKMPCFEINKYGLDRLNNFVKLRNSS